MSANNRLTLAVHALVWIVLRSEETDELATSDQIAGSINTNPVVVRRILGQLKSAGLVGARRGAGAGWYLCVEPAEVTLADVHDAVDSGGLFAVHSAKPNSHCVVGRGILPVLEPLYRRADEALREELATTTIAEVVIDVVSRSKRRHSSQSAQG